MPVTINGNGTISGLVVTTAELQDASVTTAKIAADAVTTVDIANGAVTLPKMADMATASVLGRNTAGTGAPEVLDASTARSVIGANNASNLTTGTVATARLGSGTADSTTYLRGDGTWASPTSIPANLAVGSIAILYNFSSSSYNMGDNVTSANTGYASAKPVITGQEIQYVFTTSAVRSGNVTVPGSPNNDNFPTTTAVTGTWRALSYANSRFYDGCSNRTWGKPFLAIRVA